MKIKEIKIQALHLMFATQGASLKKTKLAELEQSEQYAPYLAAMNGAINRCYADLESRGMLWPSRRYRVRAEDISEEDPPLGVRIPLQTVLPDLLRIERISLTTEGGGYRDSVEYRMEGDALLLPKHDPKRECYAILYRPMLERVGDIVYEYEECPLSDRVAAWIPYYVAGELYQEDEPGVADRLMAQYNQHIEAILCEQKPAWDLQGTVYAMTEV